ncbi:MAG: ABC transporter ATP-binding protein/permease [Lachnospiraceae bacterium]|nr:ABC transporter ATP-binding protein/permease [Lachnospiraceae bacterium]
MVRRILKEVKEYKAASIATPLCMIVEVIAEMLIPYLMASIIDKGVNAGDLNHIIKVGGLMILIAAIGLIGGLAGGVLAAKAATGFAKNLRKAMFERIQGFSFANIDHFSTAGLVTRLTTDVNTLQMGYQMALRMMMRAPASLIVALVMAFVINSRIALIYLFAVLILSLVLYLIISNAMKYFKQAFPKYDALNESVQENVSAIRVVKAYVREEQEISKFKKASQAIYDIFSKAEGTTVFQMPAMMLTVYSCILLIGWFGAKMIVSDTLTTGQLMSLLAYCMNILMSLMMVSMIFIMFSMGSAAIERIYEVLEEKSTIDNPDNPVYEVKDGSIDFANVKFAYNKDAKEDVLKNINLHIESGETIGIIGSTGSAKTSLVNLISRLYDVTDGSVKVGGVDVREYDLTTLRDKVAVVLQSNTLFSGSIYDNLRWGNENASYADCQKAAEYACADEFIKRFPDGYNTHIEQGGSNVSGGQKQRLCIARALLKSPKVLILDDSTSAVDTATEAKIRQTFREKIPDTTKIIIAQRISSVMDADRIIVMEDGQIDGFDTHENLLNNNKIYKEVYDSQMQGGGDFDERVGKEVE